ncbi:MAG: SDR family NAD(P)-dependent oxidoreductase [Rubrivivax sp.]|nr:SDR family NAD(P)-dependent oxidoreductase [Rubrivivax sp.]
MAERVVLVTGAGSGIGWQITADLAARGDTVWAAARRDEDLARLATLPNVRPLKLDLRDAAVCAALPSRLAAEAGRLDALVHNAGVGELGHLAAWSDEDLQRLFDVNVFAPLRLTRELLPLLLAARGRVICIGSQGGSITQPLYGPYTMSKHALEAFAACLRQELAPHGVAVGIVQPGAVATRIAASSLAANAARLGATPPPFDAEARAWLQRLQAPATEPADDVPESAAHRRPAPPAKVSAVVLQALDEAQPQARYLVGTRWEGDRVISALIERLLDAADSPSHRLTREELVARLDAAIAARAGH